MRTASQFPNSRVYQIKIEGLLDVKWSEWFDGFAITPLSENETLLVGSVCDQAALHGYLAKIRDLGLPLILVKQIENQTMEAR